MSIADPSWKALDALLGGGMDGTSTVGASGNSNSSLYSSLSLLHCVPDGTQSSSTLSKGSWLHVSASVAVMFDKHVVRAWQILAARRLSHILTAFWQYCLAASMLLRSPCKTWRMAKAKARVVRIKLIMAATACQCCFRFRPAALGILLALDAMLERCAEVIDTR